MDYLDFELEIQVGSGRDYTVAVLRSPAGEARATMHFPFDQLALESRLDKLQIALLRSGGKRRSVLSDEEKAVQEFGQALFEALFAGEVRNRYDVSCERAAQKQLGLRLKLRVQAPELAALPWEFLYDPRQAEYVCLSRNTPLVRYLELQQPIQSLKVTPPLRILGVIASPSDLPALDVARERERVERAVADLRAQGLVELTWLAGQTWRDLQRELQGGPWHILHFVGHGGFDAGHDEGFVCLAGEDGCTQPLYAKPLARLLADHRSLRLVLLNTCYGARSGGRDIFSSTASILLRRGIPAVLAMQDEITDRAAIAFARAFYETLARGLPADSAASEARKAVSLEVANGVEWGTPVLYMRTPDGVLFDMATPSSPLGSPPAPAEKLLEVSLVESPVQVQVTPAETATLPVADRIEREVAPASPPLARPQAAQRPRWLWPSVGGAVVLLALVVYIFIRGDYGGKPTPLLTRTSSARASAPVISELPVIVPATSAPASAITSAPSSPATAKATPEPGETMILAVPGLEVVWVPAGEFTMGSGDADAAAGANEKPQHKVDVGGFWMSRTEVTNAQYARCENAGACAAPENQDYKRPELANRPVTDVSWLNANEYARWAGGRLPTEAEWEKACRGTDARIYPWGNETPTNELARYNTSSANAIGDSPKGASPYGLLDMAGNVWEWTSSESRDYPYRGNDGREGLDAVFRVLRGGGFYDLAENLGCARRIHDLPLNRYKGFGFRVATSSPSAPSLAFTATRSAPTATRRLTLSMSPTDVLPAVALLAKTSTPSPTVTRTPLPTATHTPRPTVIPTATIDADSAVYDNFNNPAFDGTFRRDRWSGEASPSSFVQQNGILIVTLSPPRNDLTLFAIQWPDSDVKTPVFFEAKVKLISDQSPGAVFLNIINRKDYGMTMELSVPQGPEVFARCWGGGSYRGPELAVTAQDWHTLRIELNPTTMSMACYVDGQKLYTGVLAGAPTPERVTLLLRVQQYSSVRKDLVGAFDDVRIGPITK